MMQRKVYLNKVTLEEAKDKYLSKFSSQIVEDKKIAVEKAAGRVNSAPVFARRSAPHYYASAMDGIAVRAEDTGGANERNPVLLKSGEQASPVDTGAPLPEGFNAVIKIEEVNTTDSGDYRIEKAAVPWQNVRNIGESILKGELVVPVNKQLTPPDLGAIQEAGITEVNVRRRPVVGIIPTGSELVAPEVEPDKGQLPEFNSTILTAYTEEWGGLSHTTPIVPDNYGDIKETFLTEHKNNDITVIIAGSSAGEEDYTVQLLQELGEVTVHGVDIMPGKPVILAEVNGKPVLGIPGYPIAAIINYYIFVRALLYRMQGLSVPPVNKIRARVKRKVPSRVGLQEFVRVNLAEIDDEIIAVPGTRGSAAMKSLLRADGMMVIPRQSEGLKSGSSAEVYLIKAKHKVKQDLLFIGSHDLTLDLLENMVQNQQCSFALHRQSAGSMGGLMALKRGEAHLAGMHLLDGESGEYNTPYLKKYLPGRKLVVINFVYRQQGLMVQKGNPTNITSIEDIVDKQVLFLNRQRGSGTRILLDYWLEKKGISPDQIPGYEREEYTHINAAAAVREGSAATALGIQAAAEAMDLDFIPLLEEKYELVIPAELYNDRRMMELMEVIKNGEFKRQIKSLKGYRIEDIGSVRTTIGGENDGKIN